VSSAGCGTECECQDVAQKVGIAILFRRIHSDDVKLVSEKAGSTQPSG
jgi:hypothetical protein